MATTDPPSQNGTPAAWCLPAASSSRWCPGSRLAPSALQPPPQSGLPPPSHLPPSALMLHYSQSHSPQQQQGAMHRATVPSACCSWRGHCGAVRDGGLGAARCWAVPERPTLTPIASATPRRQAVQRQAVRIPAAAPSRPVSGRAPAACRTVARGRSLASSAEEGRLRNRLGCLQLRNRPSCLQWTPKQSAGARPRRGCRATTKGRHLAWPQGPRCTHRGWPCCRAAERRYSAGGRWHVKGLD